jgi:hypothetical protein
MKTKLVTAALIGTGFCVTALAQTSGSTSEEADLAMLPAFSKIDSNNDSMIDKSEAMMASKELKKQHNMQFKFEAADKNDNGSINDKEYVAYDKMLQKMAGHS